MNKFWLRFKHSPAEHPWHTYSYATLTAGLPDVFSICVSLYVGRTFWARHTWRVYAARWYKGGEIWLGPVRLFWARGGMSTEPEEHGPTTSTRNDEGAKC